MVELSEEKDKIGSTKKKLQTDFKKREDELKQHLVVLNDELELETAKREEERKALEGTGEYRSDELV